MQEGKAGACKRCNELSRDTPNTGTLGAWNPDLCEPYELPAQTQGNPWSLEVWQGSGRVRGVTPTANFLDSENSNERQHGTMAALLLALHVLVAFQACWALDNGLAQRPPMGINTWNVRSPGPAVYNVLLRPGSPRGALQPLTRVLPRRPSTTKSTRRSSRKPQTFLSALASGMQATPMSTWTARAACNPCPRSLLNVMWCAAPSVQRAACDSEHRRAPAVLADGWATRERNGSQPITYNATRFPNGIRALATYVHARGAPRRRFLLPPQALSGGTRSPHRAARSSRELRTAAPA